VFGQGAQRRVGQQRGHGVFTWKKVQAET